MAQFLTNLILASAFDYEETRILPNDAENRWLLLKNDFLRYRSSLLRGSPTLYLNWPHSAAVANILRIENSRDNPEGMASLLHNILARIRAFEVPMNQFSEILRVQTDRLEIHRLSLNITNEVNRGILDAIRMLSRNTNTGTSDPPAPSTNPSTSQNSST